MGKLRLNKEQQAAVAYNKGPLLIVAGAGTGKTTVITEKVKNLIDKKLASTADILALTFTQKAAYEMEERVDAALPYGYFQMNISTFHSFADHVLRQEASHIGLDPGYRLMTTAENVLFLRSNLFAFKLSYFRPLGNPTRFLGDLLQHFSRLRDEAVSPTEYLAYAKRVSKRRGLEKEEREKTMELARVYQEYERLKIKKSLMDFSDLIYYVLKLFKTRRNILAKYQKQFRYVLVDEFQDTNIAQYLMLKALCPPKKNPPLTVVGDDSQAIYKFRGASVSNILAFMKDYKNARQITLSKNYRSLQPILDASYRLIKFNDPDTLEAQLGISKNLVAQRSGTGSGNNPPISFHLFNSFDEEAEFVAQKISELKETYNLSQIAILARANNHLQGVTRALSHRGILYQFHGPSLLLKDENVRDLIAYLNVLVDPDDSVSLFQVLSMREFAIAEREMSRLLGFARRVNLTLFHALEVAASSYDKKYETRELAVYGKYLPPFSPAVKEKFTAFFVLLKKHLARRRRDSAGQLLYYFLEDTGILATLSRIESPQEERRAQSTSKFFSLLKSYEMEHEDASAAAIADYLKMNEELGDSPLLQEADKAPYEAVHLLTVHAAKGLEFPVVFIINLVAGRFPTLERAERIPIPEPLIKETLPIGDYHLEEERRLFYVGMTRGADRLFFTASSYYGEGKRARKISPFVVESLGEAFIEKSKEVLEEEKAQLSIFEYKKKPEILVKTAPAPGVFSYSQLETFLTCPRQYQLKYILKLPAPQTAAESLGISVHISLEQFYQEYQKGQKPNVKRLLELYYSNWMPIGYSSLAHQIRARTEGEKMLKNFYKNHHNNKMIIHDLEHTFKIKIADFSLVGKIDRVDDRGGGKIEIIDYKTGKVPDEKKIKNSLQLSIYFLAAVNRGLYRKKPEDVSLTFHFLQEGKRVTIKKTKEDIPKILEELKKIVAAIRTSDFKHRRGPWCDFCPYRDICCFRKEV